VPDVSVVIPSKNRSAILATTLEMALGQDGVDHEVVVVDDGSTDDTQAMLAAIEDPRLRSVRHEQSRGVGAARNRGVEEARGEWVAFLDDDDLWAPDKLRVQLAALQASGALFAYGESLVLDEERSAVERDQGAPDPAELPKLLRDGNAIPGGCSNVVTRRKAALAVGGFDPKLSMVADWDMWLRLADEGPAVRCPETVVAYRKHTRNMSLGAMLVEEDPELVYFADKLWREHGVRFDAVGYADWLAEEAPSTLLSARIHLRAARAYRSPAELARAAGAMLGARPALRAARRARAAAVEVPDWLEPHRAATER
jgi:glycosyltransferase involved in cell wall biosynthesis